MPVVPVDDVDDGRLTDYRTVSDPVLLRERGVFVAESRLVVRELLAHPRFETRSLLVTQAALESLGDLLEARDDDRFSRTAVVKRPPEPGCDHRAYGAPSWRSASFCWQW